jgi:hypothetical protein
MHAAWRCLCHYMANRKYVSALIAASTHSSLVCMRMYAEWRAISWPTGSKSLLLSPRSTHGLLMRHDAIHGEQAVSLCTYHHAALTAHSCVCAYWTALSLPSHGEQEVSLCSYRRAALTAYSCVCAYWTALSLPSHGEQRVSLCSYRRAVLTAHSCVCACVRRGAVSAITW